MQIGTPQEIYQRPANTFVADFIGRANFLDGKVSEMSDGYAVVDVLGQHLETPRPAWPVATGQPVHAAFPAIVDFRF